MPVVWKLNTTGAGASLSPLQHVERPADSTLEEGGKDHWIKSKEMPTYAYH